MSTGATTPVAETGHEWLSEPLVAHRRRRAPGVSPGRRLPFATLALLAILGGAGDCPAADERFHDFDRDGLRERIVQPPGGPELEEQQSSSGEWMKADFQLPEGVAFTDAQGRDAGLRFVDLNRDGFDDILFSNRERFAIHLWTKNVQPHLGWTKGWTQFVRSGSRSGSSTEPPIVSGSDVRVQGDVLVITRREADPTGPSVERVSLPALIAFETSPPRSPEEALATFQVRPGFRVELVAAEPVVIDPVAFDWSADGRLWVVEMRDYPQGLDGQGAPGGVIKVIEDIDGDGRYDRAVPFLENLAFPTSLMAWREGVLIAAAPEIFYAEDRDGDGRADVRRALLTGFTPGNQQHRVNGFECGLDGWVYVANGDSGGRVRSGATGKELDIRGRDLRFRPDTGEFETVSGQTQYGLRRDDWGNWFGNNNPAWLWHVTLPEHYLRRNPKLAVRGVKQTLANYADATRVFPISPAAVRPNQPWSLNHVTSACSPTPYRDDLFGADFATSVFVSEPVHNAIHREVLDPAGATFASHRAAGEEQSEFLASTDNWFRPTTTKVGPDGALYVADMYRLIIEHPEWISPEMRARVDVRAGSDRGRIYRVVPEGAKLRPIPNLARLDDHALAAAMNSPNGWQRDTVQRLLRERGASPVAPDLARLVRPAYAPQVRLQALATMGTMRVLAEAPLLAGLNDPHPAVRREALRLSEAWGGQTGPVLEAVTQLTGDSDARVRVQAAFSLGAWPTVSEPLLERLAQDAGDDDLLRIAIMSSLPADSGLFQRLNASQALPKPAQVASRPTPTSADRAAVILAYRDIDRLTGDPSRGRVHFQTLCAPCHRLRGDGNEVGPDLGMVTSKPTDWLVAAILDPSQAIEARYQSWTIRLGSGEELSGLITAETANNLVLRTSGGIDHPVLRTDIKESVRQMESLMPAGFESALDSSAMADLLAWLRRN